MKVKNLRTLRILLSNSFAEQTRLSRISSGICLSGLQRASVCLHGWRCRWSRAWRYVLSTNQLKALLLPGAGRAGLCPASTNQRRPLREPAGVLRQAPVCSGAAMHAPACLLLVLLTGTRIQELSGEWKTRRSALGSGRAGLDSWPWVGGLGSKWSLFRRSRVVTKMAQGRLAPDRLRNVCSAAGSWTRRRLRRLAARGSVSRSGAEPLLGV